jgi:hypothetical protein
MMASLRSIQLVVLCALLTAAPVAAQPICRPTLTVQEESFSKPFNLRRIWTASIDIDASRCATTSGLFSIGFIRLAENAPDLSFVEPFVWRLGAEESRRRGLGGRSRTQILDRGGCGVPMSRRLKLGCRTGTNSASAAT